MSKCRWILRTVYDIMGRLNISMQNINHGEILHGGEGPRFKYCPFCGKLVEKVDENGKVI